MEINLNTGWPFGEPEINSILAAGQLFVQKFSVQGIEKFIGKINLLEDT